MSTYLSVAPVYTCSETAEHREGRKEGEREGRERERKSGKGRGGTVVRLGKEKWGEEGRKGEGKGSEEMGERGKERTGS
jgi:hypothetical protein